MRKIWDNGEKEENAETDNDEISVVWRDKTVYIISYLKISDKFMV